MSDSELDDIDTAADPESSAPVRRLVAEVRRLQAVLDEIRVLAHDDLCRPGTDSAFLPEIEALARAALASPAAESNR
jgi:hypothetical protein